MIFVRFRKSLSDPFRSVFFAADEIERAGRYAQELAASGWVVVQVRIHIEEEG